MMHEIIVDRANVRLDVYLSESVPEISRSYAVALIADGLVLVNGNKVKQSSKMLMDLQ